MSIIEAALQRVRNKEAATAPAPGVSAVDAANMTAPLVTGTEPLQPRAGRRTISLEQKALDAAGLAAPEQLQRRQMHEYRNIKRALLENVADESLAARSLIMVTSALAGDGKTYTSFNLARSMALELDHRVVLVDADVLSRGLSRALGVQDMPGLVDLLRDEHLDIEDVLLPTSDANLCVMPAGRLDDSVNELLSSERMKQITARLAAVGPHQITILDSPPLLLTSEAGALVAVAGQVVLVVRAFITGQDDVRDAIARIDQGKKISAVFNAWEPSGPFDKHYGLYYGAEESQANAAKRRR